MRLRQNANIEKKDCLFLKKKMMSSKKCFNPLQPNFERNEEPELDLNKIKPIRSLKFPILHNPLQETCKINNPGKVIFDFASIIYNELRQRQEFTMYDQFHKSFKMSEIINQGTLEKLNDLKYKLSVSF